MTMTMMMMMMMMMMMVLVLISTLMIMTLMMTCVFYGVFEGPAYDMLAFWMLNNSSEQR